MSIPECHSGSPAVHGGLFLVALATAAVGVPTLSWPWYLLLPLIAYAALVAVLPPLRRTRPRLAVGRMTGLPLACAVALSVGTAGVLVGFHLLMKPDVATLAANLPAAAFGNLLLAGMWFSVLNAALEELVFRGILWETVAAE